MPVYEGEVCARIGDGLPSLVLLRSTAAAGRFIDDLAGRPFFSNGALYFRRRTTGAVGFSWLVDVIGVLVVTDDDRVSGVAHSGGAKSEPGSEVLMVRLCVFGL